MVLANNILVSTTPTVQGREITAYIDVVTTHVVAGAGLFSDIAASWSDVFGGRSKSYQKQLTQINDEAVSQLRQEAADVGGNAIVGLRIDHDQISSQGKAMFMVTASGTAVELHKSTQTVSKKSGSPNVMTSDELDIEVRKNRILTKMGSGDFSFEESAMAFLRKHRIGEAAPHLLPLLEDVFNLYKTGNPPSSRLKSSKAYFMSIPPATARTHLYDAIHSGSKGLANFAAKIVKARDLFDPDETKKLLDHKKLLRQKFGLLTLTFDKARYSRDDLPKLATLLKQVENGFPEIVDTVEKEHTFSSKTTTKWKCLCGTDNAMDVGRCKRCKRDRRGFKPNDTTPEKAKAILDRKIKALQRRLS